VIGATAGVDHSLVWTEEGRVYSFGQRKGVNATTYRVVQFMLGRGDEESELMPGLIEGPLVGKKVIGASAGCSHSLVWTEEGRVYSFGSGCSGRLGHGGEENELVPRLIEGPLVGKVGIGATAGYGHSLVWTEEGRVYSFGFGGNGRLGHGGEENELVPRLQLARNID